jgi:hypothetical protein
MAGHVAAADPGEQRCLLAGVGLRKRGRELLVPLQEVAAGMAVFDLDREGLEASPGEPIQIWVRLFYNGARREQKRSLDKPQPRSTWR